jgi:hypothetical protein
MDTLLRDKIDKTTSWSSEKGVWEWPEMRDLGKINIWYLRMGYSRYPDNRAESLRDPEIQMIKPQHDSQGKKYQI